MPRSGDQQAILATLEESLADARDSEGIGARLAPLLRPGMVITLSGALGAGKTTLVRGLLRALGVRGRVKSPSYALVEVYEISSLYWYHFDFYRVKDPREVAAAGLREYFRPDSICLIEWPERAPDAVGPVDLALRLEFCGDAGGADAGGGDASGADARRLTLEALTPAGVRVLHAYRTARRND